MDLPKLVQIKRIGSKLFQGCDIYIGPSWKKDNWKLKKSKWYNSFKSIEEYTRRLIHQDLNEISGKVLGCICDPSIGLCHGDTLINIWKQKNKDFHENSSLENKYQYINGIDEVKGLPYIVPVDEPKNRKIRSVQTNPQGISKFPWPTINKDDLKESIYIDECGMGCLFGYMAISCMYIDPDIMNDEDNIKYLQCVHDSKLLKVHEREYIFNSLKDNRHIIYHIEKCPPAIIDQLGIHQAWKMSIQKSIEIVKDRVLKEKGVEIKRCYLDGNKTVESSVEVICEVDGDKKYAGIGLASIFGKVTRDKDIEDQAEKYPVFTEILKKSKGYAGGELHMSLIRKGIYTDQHRKTFNPLREYLQGKKIVSKRKYEILSINQDQSKSPKLLQE
jgi:ribonuclease HII